MKKTLVLIIIFLSLCIALTLVIFRIDFSGEEEFVQEFLQKNYNISENGMNSFSQVFFDQDGSKTEKELERYTKKTYGKYFTQTGLEESIESKSLLSNEFSLLINKNHIESDNISISKSTFYTQESPCFNFNITTQIFGQSNESISCEPTGVIYLQKTFWGWKIDRFLPDYKTSVSFTVSNTNGKTGNNNLDATDPVEVVRADYLSWLKEDYTISIKVLLAEVDDSETQRQIDNFKGSDLAAIRGWTDAFLDQHFVVVKVMYECEFDHTKTFMDDGKLEGYVYLTRDPQSSIWTIVDRTSPSETT